MGGPFQSSLGGLDERRLLTGVYIARLSIANALAVAATVVRTTAEDSPPGLPLVFLIVGIPTAWTIASVLYGRRWAIGSRFLTAQVGHDLLLTTAAVLLTGGVGSEFALIYVLLIGVAGLLLGFRGAMVTALACAAVYLGVAYWQITLNPSDADGVIVLPNLSGRLTAVLWSLALAATVFLLIGVASGMAGRRLRVQRERLDELEKELARARIDAQDILNTIESGIISIDAGEEIDFINVTARSQLGISRVPGTGEMRARPDLRGLSTLYTELVRTLRTEREAEYAEMALSDQGGASRAFSVTTTVLYDPAGRKRGAAAIVRDVEHVRRLEDLARQADRLRAVNELAAGLAHEIQNPLAAIRSAVELLGAGERDRVGEDARLMNLVVRETDRLTALIGDFMAFSRMTIKKRARVDLVAVVEDAMEVDRMAARGVGPRPVFVRPGIPYRVDGDHDLLKQVFLNLVANARAAVDGVGNARIEIRVGGQALLPELERAGPFVALEVSDNGVGIEPQVRERIFDPFFTTRSSGFGMGLAIVHRIVDLHGGMVWVDSEPGKGSIFRVAIPRAP
ncbi:MAG TPA: ATP-binding protein [Gemmatimonadota bacterium]|nr:ATP-binding protein [Gemmatimonadota bacterium]